ncbi:hypothetical protein C0991_001596, partial [Blastosporella zonata]
MRISLSSVLAAVLASAVIAEPIRHSSSKIPQGFVTTKGSQFELNGKPFWLPLLLTKTDVDSTFKQMQAAGIKVLRTWGHNAITEDELAGAKASGLTYYQVWNSGDWILNDGPQGLERLDYVIEAAGKYGIKVILTFTNNWSGYGGLELYIDNIVGANQTHDVFFTNPKTIASYQRYVKTIVNRYKNSPTIFAWELANEARCLGDLPAGPACVPGSNTVVNWYKQQSDFIRTLDPYHMITTGGEGHFYWKTPEAASDYNYNGQAGDDFDADLTLENIDFGTYHMYPQLWYPSEDHPGTGFSVEAWGSTWVKQHAAGKITCSSLPSVDLNDFFFSEAGKKANKPVILEEFGAGPTQVNMTAFYHNWVNTALGTDHA